MKRWHDIIIIIEDHQIIWKLIFFVEKNSLYILYTCLCLWKIKNSFRSFKTYPISLLAFGLNFFFLRFSLEYNNNCCLCGFGLIMGKFYHHHHNHNQNHESNLELMNKKNVCLCVCSVYMNFQIKLSICNNNNNKK